jgi:hypothetical protein
MSEKSPLEKDIERHEFLKVPLSVLVLIAFLSICLGGLGVYSYKLKQELTMKEQEIVRLKRGFLKKREVNVDKSAIIENGYKDRDHYSEHGDHNLNETAGDPDPESAIEIP